MAGDTVFSKIDLLQAYLQLEIRPEDRELLTINTHKGLYKPTRLIYGVASAPAMWQRTIENILKDMPGVVVFLDDIRIAGVDSRDHLQKLRQVFTRLQKYNIRINVDKRFTDFLKVNGITQRLTAPYHPATNGQAERYVQILKNSLKRMKADRTNIQPALQQLLIQYRNTPHAKTGISPAEILFSRKLRTRLDLLRPTVTKERSYTPSIIFKEGKRVSCRNYIGNVKWVFGKVLKQLGDLHYNILLDDGRIAPGFMSTGHIPFVNTWPDSTKVQSSRYEK
nr:PREDICTED: uncharacterized protein K02A2.6-like [Megachile rotundata]